MKTTRNIALRILLVLVSRTVTAFSTARTSIVSAAHHDNIHQKDRYYGYFIPIVKPRRPKVWEGERSSRLNVAPAATASVLLSPSHTFLVRILFLRAAAFVYGIAFLVALRQNKALIGDRGITPARRILEQAEAAGTFKRRRRLQWRNNGGDATREEKSLTTTSGWRRLVPKLQRPRFGRMLGRAIDGNEKLVHLREILWDRSVVEDRPVTTLLWLARDRTNLNHWLDGIALTGLGLSGMILFMGAANVPIMLAVWLCHRSLMAVGGVWYGYGWEPQLSELGFHTLFCVPLLSLDPFCPVRIPAALIWCIRWYLFRVRL